MPSSSRRSTRQSGMSLPASFEATTRATRSNLAKRRSYRKSLMKEPSPIPSTVGADKENTPANNCLPSPGPTPYWKVAAERECPISPPMTRSTKKKKQTHPTLEEMDENIDPSARNLFSKNDTNENKTESVTMKDIQALMNQQLRSQSTEDKKLVERIATLEHENKQMKTTVESLEQSNKELKDENLGLQTQTSEACQLREQLESQLSNARTEAAEKSSENKMLQTAYETLRAELLVEKTRHQGEVDALKRESSVKLEGQGESRRGLELQLSSLTEEKSKLSDQLANVQSELSTMKDNMGDLKAINAELDASLKHKEQSIQRATEELDEVKKHRDELRSKMEKTRSTLDLTETTTQETVSQLSSELERQTQINRELSVERKELQSALTAAETQMNDAKLSEAQKNELYLEILSNKNELENNLKTNTLQIAEAETKMNHDSALIEELKANLVNIRREIETESQKYKDEKEKYTRIMTDLQDQITEKDQELEEMAEELAAFETDLRRENMLRTEADEKLETAESEVSSLKEELDTSTTTLNGKIQALEKEYKALGDELANERETVQSLFQAKTEALTQNANHSKTQDEMEKTILKLNEQVQQATAELQNTQSNNVELKKKIEQLSEERDKAITRVRTFDAREEELVRKLHNSDAVRRDLHNKVLQLSGNIRVFVRVRPVLPSEKDQETTLTKRASSTPKTRKRKHIESHESETPFRFPSLSELTGSGAMDDLTKNAVEVLEPYKDRGGLSDRRKKWKFGFDGVFTPAHTQQDIWEAAEPLIQSTIDGFNVCIFAYGQTGSGKSYTMLGDDTNEGLIGRSVSKLFSAKSDIEMLSKGESTVNLSVELLEIYNETVRDLLAPKQKEPQHLKINNNEVVGNLLVEATSREEVMKILKIAQSKRCIRATNSNADSSRSHMVFTIHFHVSSTSGSHRSGKLHICDLAGSERLGKSGANAVVGSNLMKETKNINSSLSVLSNVIEKLQRGDKNVPFRESKLTMLLQNSLGGNSKTLAVVCCNPLESHFHESLCSLRFADKVNKVDLKAAANFVC